MYYIIEHTWKTCSNVTGVIVSTGNQILESLTAMGKHRKCHPHCPSLRRLNKAARRSEECNSTLGKAQAVP